MEILGLLLASLDLLAISDVHVDLGHVGIFRGLAQDAGLSASQENELFDALQRKAVTEIDGMLAAHVAEDGQRSRLAALAQLNGGRDVLDRAREQLAGASPPVMAALDNLTAIADLIKPRADETGARINFDLAELRGYKYQTGMVFAMFVPGCGQEIARGGRYDAVGEVFGRARPATGFSTDLKTLMDLSPRNFGDMSGAIFAPAGNAPGLFESVQELRNSGERVVCALPGQSGDAAAMGCDRMLVQEKGSWIVKPV